MLAAYHGHAELVKLLMQHGADPNRINDRGQSPLAGAVFKKEEAVIEVCIRWQPSNIVQMSATNNPPYCTRLCSGVVPTQTMEIRVPCSVLTCSK
jgi:hypothetical protein